jgi:hypothetical protein
VTKPSANLPWISASIARASSGWRCFASSPPNSAPLAIPRELAPACRPRWPAQSISELRRHWNRQFEPQLADSFCPASLRSAWRLSSTCWWRRSSEDRSLRMLGAVRVLRIVCRPWPDCGRRGLESLVPDDDQGRQNLSTVQESFANDVSRFKVGDRRRSDQAVAPPRNSGRIEWQRNSLIESGARNCDSLLPIKNSLFRSLGNSQKNPCQHEEFLPLADSNLAEKSHNSQYFP